VTEENVDDEETVDAFETSEERSQRLEEEEEEEEEEEVHLPEQSEEDEHHLPEHRADPDHRHHQVGNNFNFLELVRENARE